MILFMALIDEPTDKEKFIELYEKYKYLMLYIAMEYLHDRGKAEDAVQEAFISIAKNIKKIEKPCNKSKNLCVIIVRNKCIDMLRREKGEVISIEDVVMSDDSEDLLEQALNRESAESIQKAMNKLKENYRMVLQLYYYHEYSEREIAGILGISENNVNVRLCRAKKNLKKLLENEV